MKTEIDRRYTGPNVVTYKVTLADGAEIRVTIADDKTSAWDALLAKGIDPTTCIIELAK